MTSATTYKQAAIVTTPIHILPASYRTRCPSCHRMVTPNVIKSAFVARAEGINQCPCCSTVLANGNGKRAGEG